MQEGLDNNNTLIYFIHNEDKCVIPERFIKIFNAKIYLKSDS